MKTILLSILLFAGFFCSAQVTLKEQLAYQKKSGVILLSTGGGFAHLSGLMFYNAATVSECNRYNKTDFICAGAVFIASALPCIVVGAIHLARHNSKGKQYNFNLTIKNSGTNMTAALNF